MVKANRVSAELWPSMAKACLTDIADILGDRYGVLEYENTYEQASVLDEEGETPPIKDHRITLVVKHRSGLGRIIDRIVQKRVRFLILSIENQQPGPVVKYKLFLPGSVDDQKIRQLIKERTELFRLAISATHLYPEVYPPNMRV